MKPLIRTLSLALAASLTLAAAPASAAGQPKTIKAVMHAALTNLDPIQTTADIALLHGMMVYDTLFSWDENLVAKPQMVESYTLSDDKLTYTFTLREGLKWHDGQPVKAEDCVASIQRWWVRDTLGQRIAALATDISVVDDRSFRLVLKAPFGYLLDALAKTGSNFPAMMPKRLAQTSPSEQIREAVGSGPFKFVREEWVPGSKAVYVKNEDYVPRNEPPSGTAGGKIAKADRVEWVVMPDQQTAQAALMNGEIDFIETPQADFIPMLRDTQGVKIETTATFGIQGILRMNHLQPPFDNPAARQGLLALVNQETYLRAIIGNPDFYQVCDSIFVCGSPLQTRSKLAYADDKARVEAAKRLFKEAGYQGEPIVILNPTDSALSSAAALVTAQLMREAGLNVDVQSMDWASVVARRPNKGKPSEGGWNIFISNQSGMTASNPLTNLGLAATCEKAWFGWPCDEKIEALRNEFATAETLEDRRRIAQALQDRADESVPYISFGQWSQPVAYRGDRLSGILKLPNSFAFWNIAVK
ncbi:ABC transporter substrate-binding protein [Bordetella sp. BOR01]|uniref:ABC transporter substrate-binding protein n=1 Tax=Bordetella sp. BOR01 TaxID=2854779 RepID=UPI001C48E962|nr:ABC transporter substrate-binding protein [Bordetella sp. BOR01]MBV7484642.1 ABC transporter substrate-binding protein [Bordetella sp. BOR01]